MKNLFMNAAARAKSFGASFSTSRARRAASVALVLMAASVIASANQAALAQLDTQVTPWITTGIKIFGGILGLGGFAVAINGFTGTNEGFDKVQKIAVGFVGIALGIWCIADPTGISTMLHLNQIFQ